MLIALTLLVLVVALALFIHLLQWGIRRHNWFSAFSDIPKGSLRNPLLDLFHLGGQPPEAPDSRR